MSRPPRWTWPWSQVGRRIGWLAGPKPQRAIAMATKTSDREQHLIDAGSRRRQEEQASSRALSAVRWRAPPGRRREEGIPIGRSKYDADVTAEHREGTVGD